MASLAAATHHSPKALKKPKRQAPVRAKSKLDHQRSAAPRLPSPLVQRRAGVPSHEPIQAKVTVSEPDDQFEKEADRIAEQIIRMPDTAFRGHPDGGGARSEGAENFGGPKPRLNATLRNPAVPNPVVGAPGEGPQVGELETAEIDQQEDDAAWAIPQRALAFGDGDEGRWTNRGADGRDGMNVQRATEHGFAGAGTSFVQRACNACSEAEPDLEVQRMANGLAQRACAECDAQEPELDLQRVAVQRACAECAEEESVQTAPSGNANDRSASTAMVPAVGVRFEQALSRARATGGQHLPGSLLAFFEPRFGQSFAAVRVHTDARADLLARSVRAKAFTIGSDLFFSRGAYQPSALHGRRLIAHELTHVLQQRGGLHSVQREVLRRDVVQRACAECADEQDEPLQRQITGVEPATGAPVLQRAGLVDDALGTLGGIGALAGRAFDQAGELLDEASDGARAVLNAAFNQASTLASALGGSVSFSGTSLIVTVSGPLPCPALPFNVPLPGVSVFVPLLEGVMPLGPNILIKGAIGPKFELAPTLGIQLGPCRLNSLRIAIDPFSAFASAAWDVEVSAGASVGAIASAAARAEASLVVLVPAGPIVIPIEIPLVGIDVGAALEARVGGIGTVASRGSAVLSGLSFSASSAFDVRIGTTVDAGVGAFGAIDVLGQTLCRINWPLFTAGFSDALEFGVHLGIGASPRGVSLSFALTNPPGRIPFDSLPFELPDVLSDDCVPLDMACEILSLLPVPKWTGHTAPAWGGPRPDIQRRNPGVASGKECRGACGSECSACGEPRDVVACQDTGNGRHEWWTYPNYVECSTHKGCRDFDACTDACAAGGFTSAVSPCTAICALACVCDDRASTCAELALGGGPRDPEPIAYSDAPTQRQGCRGPCPDGDPNEDAKLKLCLPDIHLFDPISKQGSFVKETEEVLLLEKTVNIPIGDVVVPLSIKAFAKAILNGDAHARLGPGTLTGVCLEVDPQTFEYSGTAKVVIDTLLEASIALSGALRIAFGLPTEWLCLDQLLQGILKLTGKGTGTFNGPLTADVRVTCRGGNLVVESGVALAAKLKLLFELLAQLDVLVVGFNVFSKQWVLAQKELSREWNWGIRFPPFALNPGGPATPTEPVLILPGRPATAGAPAPTAPSPGVPGGPAAPPGGGGAPTLRLSTPVGGPAGGAVPPGGGGGASSPPATPPGGAAVGAAPFVGGAATTTPTPIINGADDSVFKDILGDLLDVATQGPDQPKEGADTPDACKPSGADCGSPQLPRTVLTFAGGDRGDTATADPLTRCKPTDTEASRPDPKIFGKAFDACVPTNQRKSWGRSHLIAGKTPLRPVENLHGPGEGDKGRQNLSLTTQSLNTAMAKFEAKVIDLVWDEDKVLHYESNVTERFPNGDSGFVRCFGAEITVSYYEIDPVTRKKIPGGKQDSDDFSDSFGRAPVCTSAPPPGVACCGPTCDNK